jgi:hypothetical protein
MRYYSGSMITAGIPDCNEPRYRRWEERKILTLYGF